MEELYILTNWVQTADGNEPKLIPDGYEGYFQDMTDQPTANITPAPNQVVWRARVSTATANVIATDPDHFVLSRVTI